MISAADPEKLQSDLSAFSESQINHAQKLEAVVQDYTKLIEAYRNLKSDYEEARDSREKYKRIAKECVSHDIWHKQRRQWCFFS
jgi:hypothetical protein